MRRRRGMKLRRRLGAGSKAGGWGVPTETQSLRLTQLSLSPCLRVHESVELLPGTWGQG